MASRRQGSRIQAWGRDDRLTDATFDRLETLTAYADERGVALLDVAIGGLAAQPTVASVIAGATSAAQVRANVAAGEWLPTTDDLSVLDRVTS